jgi:regulator of sirC expression with transglutaminase-like and TPR domain
MDAIIHLAEKLDTTGDLAYAIEKRMLEANLDTLVELSAMSDDQQRAYFLEKQNARLLKSSERRIQSEQETAKSNQLRGHVDQLREAYKVSVEQYSEAFEELKRLPNAGECHS